MYKNKKNASACFFLLLCTLSITTVVCQVQTTRPSLSVDNAPFFPSSILSPNYIFNLKPFRILENKEALPNVFNLRSIMTQTTHSQQASYNCAELAFFCRLEVRMEKAAKLPVKFRLGDLQYVDYLEGKREAWRYDY